ncbi:MAG: tetratricopeptide repeat protein [Calditrichaeota bacterium]|nr:tetratricopeptide repeat protein [Calditrichota bacterium]
MSCNLKTFIYSLSILLIYSIFFQCKEEGTNKIPITTSSEEALSYFLEGKDLSEKLRLEEAYKFFQKAIGEDPDFALAHLYSSITAPNAEVRLEELENAISLKNHVTEGERLIIEGMEATFSGSYKKQQDCYRKLVELYPEDEQAYYLLGNSYFSQHDYNLALGEYRRATEINANFAPVYNQLGYAHKYLGNYQEAEEAFKQYIKLISDDPNPHDSYAELQMKMGKFQKSISLYEKALKIEPEFFNSYIGIATNLNFLGRHKEARQVLKKALEIPHSKERRYYLYYALSVSFVDEGKFDSAKAVLKNTSGKDFSNLHLLDFVTLTGVINEELGEVEKAENNYKQASEILTEVNLPEDIKNRIKQNLLYHKASLFLRTNDIAEAKKITREFGEKADSTQNRHQLWLYHELLGRIAMKENNFTEALGEFRRSNLENPYNLFRMAQAYYAMGDISKAREFLEKTIHHNTFNSLEYALVRHRAEEMLGKF